MQTDTQNGDFPVWFPIFMNEGGGRELLLFSSLSHQGVEQHAERVASNLSHCSGLCVCVCLPHNIKATFRAKNLQFMAWRSQRAAAAL